MSSPEIKMNLHLQLLEGNEKKIEKNQYHFIKKYYLDWKRAMPPHHY